MTEVLAHTISMLRGRNGSNSSRNLEWDALDTLPSVCPPAEFYIHADYIHRVLYIHADYTQATDIFARYILFVGVVQVHANRCQQFSMQSETAQQGMLEANNFANNVQCSQQFSMQSKVAKSSTRGCLKPTILPTMYNVANNFQCRGKVANSSEG